MVGAAFAKYAYPLHTHTVWTLLILDDGAMSFDLDRHDHDTALIGPATERPNLADPLLWDRIGRLHGVLALPGSPSRHRAGWR